MTAACRNLETFLSVLMLAMSYAGELDFGVSFREPGSRLDSGSEDLQCAGSWSDGSQEVAADHALESNSSGEFTCDDPSKRILIFVAEVKMNLIPDPAVYKTSSTLSCMLRAWPNSKTGRIAATLRMVDQRGSVVVATAGELDMAEFGKANVAGIEKSIRFDEIQEPRYNCTVEVELKNGGRSRTGQATIARTFSLYQPPTNVSVSSQLTVVREPVECTAEGFPNVTYDWSCMAGDEEQQENWRPDWNSLTFMAPGTYDCVCMASQDLDGRLHSERWSGKIDVLEKDSIGEYAGSGVTGGILMVQTVQETRVVIKKERGGTPTAPLGSRLLAAACFAVWSLIL